MGAAKAFERFSLDDLPPVENGLGSPEVDGVNWMPFAFLTTEANDVVRPVHEHASPVILVDPAEQAEWLAGGKHSFRYALLKSKESPALTHFSERRSCITGGTDQFVPNPGSDLKTNRCAWIPSASVLRCAIMFA